MRIQRVLMLSILAAVVCCFAAIRAGAQPTPGTMPAATPPVPAHSLIHVSACSAALNVNQTGGWVGYSPGWYGGRWADPWGGMYYQPGYATANPQLAID